MNKKKLIIFCLSIFLITPFVVNAGGIEFVPQVTIPGNNSMFTANNTMNIDSNSIANYIKSIYDYLLAIVGLTAAIALMIGGTLWLTSGGSSQRVSQAKSWISGSLTGLVLALLSYLILQTINPNLIEFKSINLAEIKPIETGCCKYKLPNGKSVAIDVSDVECYRILIDPSRVGKTIATTTQDNITKNFDGKTSEYIKKLVDKVDYMFDTEKSAEGGICVEIGWCRAGNYNYAARTTKTICDRNGSEFWEATGRARLWVGTGYTQKKPADVTIDLCEGSNHKGIAYIYKESNLVYSAIKLLLTAGGDRYSFWCYNGRGYKMNGWANEPCGNENSICLEKAVYDKYCDDGWDLGGRSCVNRVSCCKKSSINPKYYTDF